MNNFYLIIYYFTHFIYSSFVNCWFLFLILGKKSHQVSWHWEGSSGLLGRVLQWEGIEKDINAAQSYLEILVKMFPVVFLGRSWEFFLPFPHTFPFDTILPHWESKNIKNVSFVVSANKPFILLFSPTHLLALEDFGELACLESHVMRMFHVNVAALLFLHKLS